MKLKKCAFCNSEIKYKTKEGKKYYKLRTYCGLECRNKSYKGRKWSKETLQKILNKNRQKFIPNKFVKNGDEAYIFSYKNNIILTIVDTVYLDNILKYRVLKHGNYIYLLINGKNVNIAYFILGKPNKGYVIDHINRNKTDNRLSNLRYASYSQNMINRPYKGYSYDSSRKKFIVHIKLNGKTKHIGRFNNENDAILARNKSYKEYFGEFSPFK